MKLLVGLGNFGAKYENTRHNVGFMVLSAFAKKYFPEEKWKFEKKFNAEIILVKGNLLAKPLTFMNSSGDAVQKLSAFYKIPFEDILVIHDDLDIPLGEFRLQKGRGAAGHHGVESIIEALGTNNFWRLRVGIDSPLIGMSDSAADFVLENFSGEELSVLDKNLDKIFAKIHNCFKGLSSSI